MLFPLGLIWTSIYVWLVSFNERWVGIVVQVRSTKVLHVHSGGITTSVSTMNYNTSQKRQ